MIQNHFPFIQGSTAGHGAVVPIAIQTLRVMHNTPALTVMITVNPKWIISMAVSRDIPGTARPVLHVILQAPQKEHSTTVHPHFL
jgi:predicted secreted protein